MSVTQENWPQVVANAIKAGWLPKIQLSKTLVIAQVRAERNPRTVVPADGRSKNERNLECMRRIRAERKSAGLQTGTGFPLIRKKRPELAGLSGRAYHQSYEKLVRRKSGPRIRIDAT